jgi:hypothetical protein
MVWPDSQGGFPWEHGYRNPVEGVGVAVGEMLGACFFVRRAVDSAGRFAVRESDALSLATGIGSHSVSLASSAEARAATEAFRAAA